MKIDLDRAVDALFAGALLLVTAAFYGLLIATAVFR